MIWSSKLFRNLKMEILIRKLNFIKTYDVSLSPLSKSLNGPAADGHIVRQQGWNLASRASKTQTGNFQMLKPSQSKAKVDFLLNGNTLEHPRQIRTNPTQFYYKNRTTSPGWYLYFPPNLCSWTIHQFKLSKFGPQFWILWSRLPSGSGARKRN